MPFIYPNPVCNTLIINYEGFKRIEIIDLNGKIIKTVSTLDKSISVEGIKADEYIINVYSENGLLTTDKLFKAKY